MKNIGCILFFTGLSSLFMDTAVCVCACVRACARIVYRMMYELQM
jgi:hypothetical protein